jgi:hypothetical protein
MIEPCETVPKQSPGALLSEAVILAGITAAAYFFAFSYEAAYLEYFGIPSQLAVVEVKTLTLTAGALIGLALLVFPAWILLLKLTPSTGKIFSAVFWFFFVLMLLTIVVSYGLSSWPRWALLVGLAIVVGAIDISSYLLARRKGEEYAMQHERLKLEKFRRSSLSGVVRSVDLGGLSLMMVFLFLYLVIPALGRFTARTQVNFLVVKAEPLEVVLRVYSDTAIVVPLVGRDTIGKEFRVLRLSEVASSTVFTQQTIGPLSRHD